MSAPLSVVISGSFRKHLEGINAVGKAFAAAGIEVLSPKISNVINPGHEFAILESDDTHDPKTLEQRHLDAITKCDALYVFDPEGYLGLSATLEVGWALALGKPIFCKEVAQDFTLKLFCDQVATPAEVKTKILELRAKPLDTVHARSSTLDLQAVSALLGAQRGFHDEKPLEIMLMMVEEVGELAKALRKTIGLKVDAAKANEIGKVEGEAADIFIYLLHLANACNFDLGEAFKKKELVNSQRDWQKKA